MGKTVNIPSDLQEGIQDALGRKAGVGFARAVNLEIKSDKYDSRVMAFTEYRMYILSAKPPMKVETSIHFLDINCLESKTPKKLVIGTESKRLVMSSTSSEENTSDFDQAAGHILVSLAKIFPSVPTDKLVMKVDFSPSGRLEGFRKTVMDVQQKDQGPCGNFSAMYRCMCDYHNLDFQEDVEWDVDTIYQSQDSKEMNLNDFDHLDSRHLLPIISALEHNTWFTKLNASNVKLTPETVSEVLKVMKTNITIEELVLANIGVRAEFAQRLCMSLVANTGSPLTVLDLSGNAIEDKGLNHLCAPITKLSRGLVQLNLARTGITARGVNCLADALINNKNILQNLCCLDLSENSLKGEENTNFFNFLAKPNALTTLRLGFSELALENLFGALLRGGCVQNLVHLDVSGNVFSYKKQGKDIVVPGTWKQFFAGAMSLQTVNFSGCRLPPDALRSVLEGVGSNTSLTGVDLNLSSNGFGLPGNQGAQVLEARLPTVTNISSLDISDNGFDVALASILGKLSQNKSLRKLSIGRNLNNTKSKPLRQVIEAIIQLIHQEFSPIECLNVDNLRLKSDTTLLINALGSNNTLKEIDISGNQMGDIGARMLSKALQINKKLAVIYWDHNGTSPNGFQDIAAALEKNFTVCKMPTPVNDAACALRLNHEKTEQALQKIEAILQRNHNPRKLPTDQAYRLQQGFFVSSSQLEIDRHLVCIQDLIDKLKYLQQNYQTGSVRVDIQSELNRAQALLKEAETARTFLLQLQKVAQQSEDSDVLQKQLRILASNLHDVTTNQLRGNVSDMIRSAETQFPVTFSNMALQEDLIVSCNKISQQPVEVIHKLVMDHLATDLINKTSELNLTVASLISDRILDELLFTLDKNAQSLLTTLNTVRSQLLLNGQLKDEDKESQELRQHLKRHKSSSSVAADEEQDVASEMPTITDKDKHKSRLSRRLRPQSAIDVKQDSEDYKTVQVVKPKLSDSSLDFLPLEDISAPKLAHLVKDRPKRLKTKAITRPTVCNQVIDEDDVSRGVGDFFEMKSHLLEKKQNGEIAISEEHEDIGKADVAVKKVKNSVTSPKAESKGLASELMGLFKKKSPDGDAPGAPLGSESSQLLQKINEKNMDRGGEYRNADASSKKSREVEEAAEVKPVQKPPSAVGKVGLPGMAGGVSLAELRAKRATFKPSSGANETDKSPDSAKDPRVTDRKAKENIDSTSDENSALRLSMSMKGRPPPPLAPKPNKNRMSMISNSPPTSSANAPKPAVSITRGLSEAEEVGTQESEPKTEPQVIDVNALDRKKRISVREKAANIDKNSNLKAADNSTTSRKFATLPLDSSSSKQPESTAQRPASDCDVRLTSSTSNSSAAPGDIPPPTPPSHPPPSDDDSESESSHQGKPKRLSDMDVIHI